MWDKDEERPLVVLRAITEKWCEPMSADATSAQKTLGMWRKEFSQLMNEAVVYVTRWNINELPK